MRPSLEDIIARLPDLDGPIVIVGRPHSGTRALAAAFELNGIDMGPQVSPDFLDSELWYARFVLPLLSGPSLHWVEDEDHVPPLFRERLADALRRFWLDRPSTGSAAWGWKMSETLFLMTILRRYLPGAKFVHVIRDGRDVALSDNGFFQLTTPAVLRPSFTRKIKKAVLLLKNRNQRLARRYDYRRFCLNITFGSSTLKTWKGIRLDDHEALTRHRFLLQMQSWMHCVDAARRLGAKIAGGYFELRYDDFCRRPVETTAGLFDTLGIAMRPEAEAFLEKSVHARRIDKWQTYPFADKTEKHDFDSAVNHGQALLHELWYLS